MRYFKGKHFKKDIILIDFGFYCRLRCLRGVQPHAHQLKDGNKMNICSFELKNSSNGASY
jgi:hypothetical protein